MNRRTSSISYNLRSKEDVKELKVILLGEPGVGKTNIISRYLSGSFNQSSNPTIGSTFGEKNIKKDGLTYSLKVWDTTGQEKYNSITKLFVKGSHIVILVYSIDNLQSFEKLNFWYNYIKEELQEGKYILGILGNKRDLFESEVVSEEDVKRLAKKKNAIFGLVSAKIDRQGIIQFFDTILDEFIIKLGSNIDDTTMRIEDRGTDNKKCC
jgi:Ras-related protein Rab-11A